MAALTREELAARLKARKIGAAVAERVLRLNPNGCPDGSRPRGMHYHQKPGWMLGLVGKGEFIRRFGRDAWNLLPPCTTLHFGRREYVEQVAVEDVLWKLPLDAPERRIVVRGRGLNRYRFDMVAAHKP